jgi:hypothetical protein
LVASRNLVGCITEMRAWLILFPTRPAFSTPRSSPWPSNERRPGTIGLCRVRSGAPFCMEVRGPRALNQPRKAARGFLGLATISGRGYIGRMVRIAISPAAFEAIASTLPGNVGFENKRDTNGDWFIWLPHDVLTRLNHLRQPGEDYSAVILRVAADAGAVR